LANAKFTEDPMKSLAIAKSVFIKQTIEWVEMIAGYETPNRYQVYYKNPGETDYTMLFSCREMSDYFYRNCCSGESRPFILNIKHVQNSERNDDFSKELFAVLDRPFQLSLCCFCGPELVGHFKALDGPTFGKVVQAMSICDPVYHIYNSSGKIVYSITTDCLKCGFFCRGSCGMFDPITFLIFEGENFDSKQINSATGKIIKHSMGLQSLISDSDNFEVFFPITAKPEDKMNIISCALLIDYLYFEENPNSI